MATYITRGNLKVDSTLDDFIANQALLESGIELHQFWQDFEVLLSDLSPINKALLEKRESLQHQIDEYHLSNKQTSFDFANYKQFLKDIGYLEEQPKAFNIDTQNVDPEICEYAGPQLVVPINNARYALNAVNARWGSLYDALYGTDIIAQTQGLEKTAQYNPQRGQQVIVQARKWLDVIAPLTTGSHHDSTTYKIDNNELKITLTNGEIAELADKSCFVGFQEDAGEIKAILLKHNNLHIELQFDHQHPIGKTDPAGIKDVYVESALTTIMDCEDSVAAVDAEDKTLVYRNWLGLIKGELSIEMNKNGKTITRNMNPDRQYKTAAGESLSLPGRSLMFVRNVGHLMTNPAILLNDQAIPEGIMDGVITSLISKQDVLKQNTLRNSQKGSIYIVKPKMHGPEEVAFTNTLFARIEDMLKLERNTIKMGIMDEERRTSINLSACIEAAKSRVVFINTGFLDRTGDEIHTSMQLGAFAPKAELKTREWIGAYEASNVSTGLDAGLSGKAQIGKGMWPIPDQMANMMEAKIAHPKAGANTAWVPSPTAATLHALHYHQVDVFDVQAQIQARASQTDYIDTILQVPLLENGRSFNEQELQNELDNNVQGILGYVVRWVHQGIGCSKVPDINNVGLMEDRATLRISSQHIANWLHHGLLTQAQVEDSLARMAVLVDEQNKADSEYIPMTPNTAESIGFQAARDLILLGKEQPSGYTEPLLHQRRLEMKALMASYELGQHAGKQAS